MSATAMSATARSACRRTGAAAAGDSGTSAASQGNAPQPPVGHDRAWQTSKVTEFSYAESIFIDRAPQDLYDLVSDITRMGDWSPICVRCWWDEGDNARVGARFTGRNELPTRTWETRCEVVAAERGHEFAFIVGEGYVRWGYAFAAAGAGTSLTESWDFLPAGLAMFQTRYGTDAPAEIATRTRAAHDGIPATLAAIKRTAELA